MRKIKKYNLKNIIKEEQIIPLCWKNGVIAPLIKRSFSSQYTLQPIGLPTKISCGIKFSRGRRVYDLCITDHLISGKPFRGDEPYLSHFTRVLQYTKQQLFYKIFGERVGTNENTHGFTLSQEYTIEPIFCNAKNYFAHAQLFQLEQKMVEKNEK
jgi:hypothetical protein